MDIEYVDILTGKDYSSVYVAHVYITYWLVRSSRGGDGVEGVDRWVVLLIQPDGSITLSD